VRVRIARPNPSQSCTGFVEGFAVLFRSKCLKLILSVVTVGSVIFFMFYSVSS
jgi:hypothetical protein